MARAQGNYASVDDIAAGVGVSRSWLYRRFMESFGCSPTAYLRDRRLACAKQLLESTRLHISEIACSAGYPDPLYFTKVFTRRFGCSPSAYRAGFPFEFSAPV